jgi:hypothetical protein
MKKIISFTFIIVGLLLIGYGSFDFFEKYDKYLVTKNDSLHAGIYNADDESIVVQVVDKNLLEITINDETYDFSYNGKEYENGLLGLNVEFNGNNLILYKDGEELKTYSKEKK